MSDGPYDYARERVEAEQASRISTRRIGSQIFDEADVPSRAEVAEESR